jgi:cytidylate kinase
MYLKCKGVKIMAFIVAIDGPAGSGKGTVTKKISKLMGLTNIDTGITYRCVALEVLNRNIELNNEEEIIKIANDINIEIENREDKDIVYLNGEDVTEQIRSKEVTNIVSPVSSIPGVRYKMVEIQRNIAEGKDLIAEGRDICTFVFPNADVKIYLDASLEERARRRYEENREKGIDTTYEEVVDNIVKRDYNDKNKKVGALKITEDSIVIDSTHLTADEVVEKIIEIISKGYRNENNN